MLLTLNPAPKQDDHVPNIDEVVAYASKYIDKYFRGKTHDKKVDLYQMRFIKMVINYNILNHVHLIEECLSIEYAGMKMNRKQRYELLRDTYYNVAMNGIPKEFATGLILMEYILCKGIDILDDE